ncbi:RagB/SusD family nutrient uptake outer membrane protein [Cyclobacterium jeungdonense]|uniref:RagB/SusD family nutrient uptake outer membrane protein n=1 Tax=Cyclobacterium jeungdonense TaxID=708087 RepID=A0ABT8C2K0_9BACT|nr:RagB/SusD family nutrient uptake outer membrane protein [Cyclobacterium jeungdonense]MDN3686262.1 RagB/SusD family nutrient uptake outer membrane protein [Cyclobacterium jeungdonense]
MKNSIVYLLLSFMLFAACDDNILETVPYGQSTSSQFWRNGDDAVAAANAMYEPLVVEDFYGHAEHTFDIPSDDQYRAGDHGEDQAIESFTFDAGNPQLFYSWRHKYEVISRANAVLINVPDISMDQNLKNRTLGEAHFLRGFMYWRFLVIYGGVPLILEEDVLANEYNKERASMEEMHAQITADLLAAAELLPETHAAADLGRPHKGSARGLLAKLYLYQEDFAKAIEYGQQVLNGPYPLAEDFADNFRVETQNNPEMLFAIQSLQGWQENTHVIYTTPRPWGGWDFHEPVQDLIDEFEEGDPRLDYTVYQPGDMVDLGGDRGVTPYTEDLSSTGYHFRKYSSWRPQGGLNMSHNSPILRTADVYLIVAEAKIRAGQNGDAEINAVRERSGRAPLTDATMEDLIHERRVELAGENQRHQDLIRWDKAGLVDIVALYQKDLGPLKPPRTFERPKHYLFAIPQREIDLSNGVLSQNPGY